MNLPNLNMLELGDYPVLSPMDPATRARFFIRETGARIIPVIDSSEKLIGVITRESVLTITSTKSLLKVQDIVSQPPVELLDDDNIRDAVRRMLMVDEWYSPVKSREGRYVGVFGIEHYFKFALKSKPDSKVFQKRISDVMVQDVITVSPEDSISRLWRKMVKYRYAGFPVVDHKNRLVGIITQYDLIKRGITRLELESESQPRRGPRVKSIMTTSPIVLYAESTVKDAISLMLEKNISRIPIVDKNTQVLIGIVDKDDIARLLLPIT